MVIFLNDFIKCPRCKNTLINEEFEGHICNPLLQGFKEIPISYIVETKDASGSQTYLAKGLDGILYKLVKIPKIYQPKGNRHKIHRKGDRTILKNF